MNITTPCAEKGADVSESYLDEGWRENTLCAQTDPEVFFPKKGSSSAEAKRICDVCDVRAQCLAFALANSERFGIWGGLSVRERDRLRKSQAAESRTRSQMLRQERNKTVVAMAGKGTDVPSIAAGLRVSDKTVYRVLARHRAQKTSVPA